MNALKYLHRVPGQGILLITALISLTAKAQEVDLLTGRLRMSLPIGMLQANDVSIPISIYHHGTSLQTADGQGACGLGWGLSAGGAVHRQVRGLPDEVNTSTKKGWLYNSGANATAVQSFTPSANDILLNDCSDESADYNTLEGLHSSFNFPFRKDTEPDLFTVNAPGLSAQFVLDANGTPRLLTHADVIIEFLPNVLSMETIVVRTNNGMVYTFGAAAFSRESTKRGGYVKSNLQMNTEANYFLAGIINYGIDNSLTFASAWKISSIVSSATGTAATYKYVPKSTATPDGAGKRIYNLDSTNYVLDILFSYDLQSITLKSTKATFNWSGAGLVQYVVIQDTITQEQRSVRLDYMTAFSGPTTKSFLKKISANGTNCLPPEVHEFEYQYVTETTETSGAVPSYVNWKKNWGQDFFGFPNSASTKNKPTLYFAQSESDGRRLRVVPISGISSATYAGDSRTPSINGFFGALKKIRLPSGGFAEIHYEYNTYLDTSVTPALDTYGGGARVRKIVMQGGEAAYGKTIEATSYYRDITKEYEYTLAGSLSSSGKLLSPVKLGYITKDSIERVVNNLGDDPVVFYSRVVEKTIPGKGYTIYEFNVPGVFPETSNGNWKATKSRIARKPGASCIPEGNLKNGYYLFSLHAFLELRFPQGSSCTDGDLLRDGWAYLRKDNDLHYQVQPGRIGYT